jgi:Tfp pilus assembly protein PilF
MPFKRRDDTPQATQEPWFICLLLAAAVAAVFWRALDCGFVNYDDPGYVSSNPHVQSGFTLDGVVWAFTSGDESNWHPVTWLSHMLDAQVFGMHPGGHHFTNLLLHTANVILLFLLLRRMTGKLWPSAMVAALFGLHPLHVESVAWVAERKDVLSTFFWILAVWAYVSYVKKLSGETEGPNAPLDGAELEFPSKIYYVASLFFFACGLMSKPMVVTLPFVLMLLDFWPLTRLRITHGVAGLDGALCKRLLIEKTPYFAMAILSSVITFMVQQSGGAMTHSWPFLTRVENAVFAYVRYLGKTFWPLDLAFFYPHPHSFPVLAILPSVAFLGAVSAAVIFNAAKRPYLAVGWFWFLGMLAPTIGIVQVGLQSMADRYSYLPLVGIFIMLVWGLNAIFENNAAGRPILGAIAVVVLLLCGVLTSRQVAVWRDSETLFEHAVSVTKDNFLAWYNLATIRLGQGRRDEAAEDFRKTVELEPDFSKGQNNWGKILLQEGRVDEALVHLQKAVQLQPRLADAHYNLGSALLAKGKAGEALDEFQRQVDLVPNDPVAQENLANNLAAAGLVSDSIPFYERAIRLQSNFFDAHYRLANVLERQGLIPQAIAHYRQALQIQPDSVKVCNNLAWVLATSPQAAARNGAQAVQLARWANKLSGGTNVIVLGTLAAADAESGNFHEAVETAQKARDLARVQTNVALADGLERQMKLYQANQPLRDAR